MRYETPEIEIIVYDEKDIVSTSQCFSLDQIDICLMDEELQ